MAKEVQARSDNAIAVFRSDLDRMKQQFAMTLPEHIPAERFARVVLNAVNRTPRLLMCDRQSLWNACMQSAEDGLLPDKREGAIVPFKKGKDDDDGSPGAAGDYVAVWIPMVFGIRKLIRNSGELRDFNVQLVYVDEFEAGKFIHELGDSPMIKHQRMAFAGDPATRAVYCGYSIAWDKDGNMLVPEIMFENELMATARRSKSFKAGPWSDPLFALEMRKKTVTKRHFKQLPTSRDLDRVLRRDDELYDFASAEGKRKEEITKIRGGAGNALAHFAGNKIEVPEQELPAPESDGRPDRTGQALDQAVEIAKDRVAATKESQPKQEPTAESQQDDSAGAGNESEYAERFRAYLATATTAGAIDAKWKRERGNRNTINMTPELRDALDAERKARMAEIE